MHHVHICVISGFCRDVNKIFAFLRYYTVYIGTCRRFGTTYRPQIQGSSSLASQHSDDPMYMYVYSPPPYKISYA
jgi:hypothetical protein